MTFIRLEEELFAESANVHRLTGWRWRLTLDTWHDKEGHPLFVPTLVHPIHPLLHGLSACRCPMSPHFLTRWVSRLLVLALVPWAFARVGVHRPFLRLPYLGVFYSLFFTSHWISFVYFSQWRYLHPTTNPPPYSRLGTGFMVIGYPKRLRYHGGGVYWWFSCRHCKWMTPNGVAFQCYLIRL